MDSDTEFANAVLDALEGSDYNEDEDDIFYDSKDKEQQQQHQLGNPPKDADGNDNKDDNDAQAIATMWTSHITYRCINHGPLYCIIINKFGVGGRERYQQR